MHPTHLIKSFVPYLLLGLCYATFLFSDYFKSFGQIFFFLLVIFVHYCLFIGIGVLIDLFFEKNSKIKKIFIQVIYTFLFLMVGIIAFGSYFSIKHWHYPINLTLLMDFFSNAHSYITLSNSLNFPLVVMMAFISMIGIYGVLNFLYPNNLEVIKYAQSLPKHFFSRKSLTAFGVFVGVLFFLPAQKLSSSLQQFKQSYLKVDPLSHFYYNSFRRFQVKQKVAQAEYDIAQSLQKKYPLDNSNISKPTKNIILLTVDALRGDYLPAYGFSEKITPFLDSFLLENKHTIVQHPLAVCNYTLGGTVSMLEGTPSHQVGLKRLDLQNYLAHWGYQNHFVLVGNHAGFGYMDLMVGQTLDLYYEGTYASGFSTNDDRMVDAALQQFFKEKEWKSTSNFFWIHLMSAHILSKKETEFLKYHPYDVTDILTGEKEDTAEKYRNNYMNGILQMDDIFRNTLNLLSEKGILENSTIIISSDHGESIGEFGYFNHSNTLNYPELNIPIIIIDNDLPDAEIPFGSQIDIAPTIVDLLQLPIPTEWQGTSLISRNSEPVIPLFSSGGDEYGVAVPFENTWLGWIKKEGEFQFYKLNPSMEKIEETKIPDSLKNLMSEKLEVYFQ